jgi:hypothetical protein
VVAGARGERPDNPWRERSRSRPLRDDRLKELADADWRKLQAKRYLESPGRCDADGPAALPVGWWH